MFKVSFTALATGIGLLGTMGTAQAQINFDFSTTFAGVSSPTVYDGGNGGTFTVSPTQALAPFRDASGLGSTIHLVTNANGISEFATSASLSNVTAADAFDVTIFEQGGGSAMFVVPLNINAVFNAGSNNDPATSSSFTSTMFSIGANNYVVETLQLTNPGAPPIGGGSSSITGDVALHIVATGPMTTTPEPGAVAFLTSMGVTGLAFLRRKRAC